MTNEEALELALSRSYSEENIRIINALMKQIPCSPIMIQNDEKKYYCQRCSGYVANVYGNDYCHHCGQALDWSDDDDR